MGCCESTPAAVADVKVQVKEAVIVGGEEGEKKAREVLATTEKDAGPNAPATIAAAAGLAKTLEQNKKGAEAEPLFRRVVTAHENSNDSNLATSIGSGWPSRNWLDLFNPPRRPPPTPAPAPPARPPPTFDGPIARQARVTSAPLPTTPS